MSKKWRLCFWPVFNPKYLPYSCTAMSAASLDTPNKLCVELSTLIDSLIPNLYQWWFSLSSHLVFFSRNGKWFGVSPYTLFVEVYKKTASGAYFAWSLESHHRNENRALAATRGNAKPPFLKPIPTIPRWTVAIGDATALVFRQFQPADFDVATLFCGHKTTTTGVATLNEISCLNLHYLLLDGVIHWIRSLDASPSSTQ